MRITLTCDVNWSQPSEKNQSLLPQSNMVRIRTTRPPDEKTLKSNGWFLPNYSITGFDILDIVPGDIKYYDMHSYDRFRFDFVDSRHDFYGSDSSNNQIYFKKTGANKFQVDLYLSEPNAEFNKALAF